MDKKTSEFEKRELERIKERILFAAEDYAKRSRELYKKFEDEEVVSKESRQNKQMYKVEADRLKREEMKYRSYMDSPYFGRLVVLTDGPDKDGERETYLVGSRSIIDTDGTAIVIHHLEPLGALLQNELRTELRYAGYTHKALLKRRVNIRNGRFLGYSDLYNAETNVLSGIPYDEFLRELIETFRRENRPTYIIETIRGNQIEIIQLPATENLIVQGSAGSGKTIVMLHRLEHLIKRGGVEPDRMVFLVPSAVLKSYVSDVAKGMDIGDVRIQTVEDYYKRLLAAHSGTTGWEKAQVYGDSELGEELLKRVYSSEFYEEILIRYERHWDDSCRALGKTGVSGILESNGMFMPDLSEKRSSGAELLVKRISSILRGEDSYAEKLVRSEERVNEAAAELAVLAAKERAQEDVAVREARKIAAELFREAEGKQPSSGDAAEQEVKQAVLAAREKCSQTRDIIHRLEMRLDSVKEKELIYLDPDTFAELSDELSGKIAEQCEDILREISELRKQRKGFALFGRKKKARRDAAIAERSAAFRLKAAALYEHEVIHIKKEIEAARIAAGDADNAMEQLLLNERNRQEREIAGEARINELLYSAERLTDAMVYELRDVIDECGLEDVAEGLLDALDCLDEIGEKRAWQERVLDVAQIDLSRVRKATKRDPNREALEKALAIARELTAEGSFRCVAEPMLKSVYESCGEIYEGILYRHILYVRLVHSVISGRRLPVRDRLLMIDEAQDLAEAEYRLLKYALGDGCRFNIVGDTNQRLIGYKGISDWGSLKWARGSGIRYLSQNYRNTRQISDYCNKAFSQSIDSVGSEGLPVIETDITKAIERLLVQCGRGKSCALILPGSRAGDISLKIKSRWLWSGRVENGKLAVLSPAEAKGLEFDVVVVDEKDLTKNERYVAFTRAREELIVVKRKARKKAPGSILDYLEAKNLEYYDKRDKGGALWVVGNDENIRGLVRECEKLYDVKFFLAPGGGRTTDYRPSWYTRG